jgi:hypothetical protein
MKAFPQRVSNEYQVEHGMDLRDYFAGQALPSLVINREVHKVIFSIAQQEKETPEKCLAIMAYAIANEMMKAREKND